MLGEGEHNLRADDFRHVLQMVVEAWGAFDGHRPDDYVPVQRREREPGALVRVRARRRLRCHRPPLPCLDAAVRRVGWLEDVSRLADLADHNFWLSRCDTFVANFNYCRAARPGQLLMSEDFVAVQFRLAGTIVARDTFTADDVTVDGRFAIDHRHLRHSRQNVIGRVFGWAAGLGLIVPVDTAPRPVTQPPLQPAPDASWRAHRHRDRLGGHVPRPDPGVAATCQPPWSNSFPCSTTRRAK